jgi:hypothetical protein
VLYLHPPGMSAEIARPAMTLFAGQTVPDARSMG